MLELLPGGDAFPLPSAVAAHRRIGKTVFSVVATGSSLHREGLTAVRATSHLPLNAVERTTGVDVSSPRRCLDDRFDAAQGASNRAEDRVLSMVLSTSQMTAGGAEFFDDAVDDVLGGESAAN